MSKGEAFSKCNRCDDHSVIFAAIPYLHGTLERLRSRILSKVGANILYNHPATTWCENQKFNLLETVTGRSTLYKSNSTYLYISATSNLQGVVAHANLGLTSVSTKFFQSAKSHPKCNEVRIGDWHVVKADGG